GPILQNLADTGQNLPKSLQVLATYPFSDEALKAIKGDYMNVYLSITAAPGTSVIPEAVPDTTTPSTPGTAAKAVPKVKPSTSAAPLPLPTVGSPTVTPS